MIETPKYFLWVVQILTKQIQDGGRPPSWKNEGFLTTKLNDPSAQEWRPEKSHDDQIFTS